MSLSYKHTDQTNLTVTVDSQCSRARFNHQAWLEVNHCLEVEEPIETAIRRQRAGLVTSAPDPLTLCMGEAGEGGVVSYHFREENAHVFNCISDAMEWCDDATPLSSPPPHPYSAELAAPPSPVGAGLGGGAELVQVLVTGSLHLVGASMSVLGCKVEDL